jgi:putative membrane protein
MRRTSKIPQRLLAGAVSGFVATVPMTITMLAINKLLSGRQRTRLEPRKITDDMLDRVGLRDDLSEEQQKRSALAAHFSFGSAMGTIFPIVEPFLPVPRPLRGPVFGLAVWAANYAGLLPAIGTLPPPDERPRGRNLLLIASHLVWGAAVQATNKRAAQLSNGKQSK